jgi:hypothetical protein
MWVQLQNDFLNLDHVVRVRFNIGWKNGKEELLAEVEGRVQGDVQVFSRYRGQDALVLRGVLRDQAGDREAVAVAVEEDLSVTRLTSSPERGTAPTLHDM